MLSTLLIVGVASSTLGLVWSLLFSGCPEIQSGWDWKEKRHDIDVEIFQVLLDPDEERHLRCSLLPDHFRAFQRRRIRLALDMLRLIDENAGMVIRVAQLSKMVGDPIVIQKADELVSKGIQLRCNLLLARFTLYLKWVVPTWTVAIPAFAVKYEFLLDSLSVVSNGVIKT